MLTLNSYDNVGKSGMALMQTSLNTANAAAEKLSSGNAGIMDIAEASMDMSKAKTQMAMGAFLVRTQNELMDTALQILAPKSDDKSPLHAFGVGTKHSGLY